MKRVIILLGLISAFLFCSVASATFGSNSATLTNLYMPFKLGDKLSYTGTGTFSPGYGRYLQAVAVEKVGSVSCLKILVRGHANRPNPDDDPEKYDLWMAEDQDGNVRLLKGYAHESGESFSFGSSGMLWMPANPALGQVFRQLGDEYTQVQATNVTVDKLSNGLGPFSGCLKFRDGPDQDVDIEYVAPRIGSVKEEWNSGGHTNGWILAAGPLPVAAFTAIPASDRVPLAVSFTDQSTGYITSWSWDFGDGATSTEQNPMHTYRTPDNYTVSLTVTSPWGSNTEEKTDYILALRSKSTPWIPLLLGD